MTATDRMEWMAGTDDFDAFYLGSARRLLRYALGSDR